LTFTQLIPQQNATALHNYTSHATTFYEF